jgi:hydroxypyruvate isomerase
MAAALPCLRLAANVTLLYPGRPLLQRLAAAARDGFRVVEVQFPYDDPPAVLARALREHGLQLALLNTPLTPEWGLAALPGREAEFRDGVRRAFDVAAATGCPRVHVLAGISQAVAPAEAHAALLHNLAWAASQAQAAGLGLTLEALNRHDLPGYHYHRPQQVVQVLQAVAHASLGLQLDLYHVAREGLDLLSTAQAVWPHVRHLQVAGAEGRHEPEGDDPQLQATLRWIQRQGWQGGLGCEYVPRGDVAAGLARWTAPLAGVVALG